MQVLDFPIVRPNDWSAAGGSRFFTAVGRHGLDSLGYLTLELSSIGFTAVPNILDFQSIDVDQAVNDPGVAGP